MSEHYDAADLPVGTRVRTRSGIWTAVETEEDMRWSHEAGQRIAADVLITDWLDSGIARVVVAPEGNKS